MNTQCLPADQQGILQGVGILKQGGLVAFPTETVYGLGANALDAQAVAAIFAAKGRPQDNPLIAHVTGIQQAREYGQWNDLAQILAQAFWPGPLTLIVGRLQKVPAVVSAGLSTLALRAPSHPVAQALIAGCGCPVAAPSANASGRPSPTTAQHVLEDMQGRIPLILDGGPCAFGLESTVVDLTGPHPLVLRPGAVTPEMIAMVAGECQVADSVLRPLKEGEAAPSPGMRHRHYAPKAQLTLVEGSPAEVQQALANLAKDKERTWVLALEGQAPELPASSVRSLGRDVAEAAHNLFYLLRQADQEGIQRIYAPTFPNDGLGLALMNRLARAAGFRLLDAKTVNENE